jgi:hypothetical protein
MTDFLNRSIIQGYERVLEFASLVARDDGEKCAMQVQMETRFFSANVVDRQLVSGGTCPRRCAARGQEVQEFAGFSKFPLARRGRIVWLVRLAKWV